MKVRNVSFGHNKTHYLFEDLNVEIPKGKITTIIGPNGCGKSTLLSLLTKGNKALNGEILLDDINIDKIKSKPFARKVAVLHQHNNENLSITIRELVAYGRTPYEKGCHGISKEDEKIIDWALECTKLTEIQDKPLNQLSGGQRQRAWLTMSLCQRPEVLFLDEPTTYLDMYYQIELLELVKKLNAKYQMTIVMVLHDINQALNYSDYIIVMKSGKVLKTGEPKEMANPNLIEEVYQIKGKFYEEEGKYYLLPLTTC